jgi:hypothetical protein
VSKRSKFPRNGDRFEPRGLRFLKAEGTGNERR